jgi:hypothetical protein
MKSRRPLGLGMLALTGGTSCMNVAAAGIGRNPMPRVVTVSQAGLSRHQANDLLAPTLERLNQTTSFHPDIVCLPETFSNRDAERVPGPVTDNVADWAAPLSHTVFGGARLFVHMRSVRDLSEVKTS